MLVRMQLADAHTLACVVLEGARKWRRATRCAPS